jgi:AsmA-like C-terminal region/AsmA family/Protein of unknown function
LARLRKILFYFLLAAGVFTATLAASVFLFKDRIIDQFVREANKKLNTPVKIEKIDISWFEDFPNLSIVLKNVYIEDSHPGIYPLMTAASVSFQLKAFELWQGRIVIHSLQISDSETNLKIDASGSNNYTIVKDNPEPSEGVVRFAIENVRLHNTRVNYLDFRSNEEYRFLSDQLNSSIEVDGALYGIHAIGAVTTQKIRVRQTELFTGKTFTLESDLDYDDQRRKLTIKPSELKLRSSKFLLSGEYRWKEETWVDLAAEGKETDIQTLLSLMPESVSKSFEKYRSKGDMRFTARLKGEVSRDKSPSLTVDFGFKGTTLYHPDYRSKIENANLEGSFASVHVADPTKAVLILKNINGELNGKSFEANLTVHNFKDSEVQLDFNGALDAASVADFYPIGNVANVSGDLLANLTFEGRLSWLKNRATAKRTSTKGSVELKNLSFSYGEDKVPIRNITGNLQFNNNDLALSNVKAQVGNSDFLLNGYFKNVITFFLFDDQPIGIEADLKSNFLDLDELFALGFGKGAGAQSSEYEFKISSNINMNFNCDVKSLRYKRFHAQQIKGDVLVKNKMAVSRNISLRSMGGDISFSGIVDAKKAKTIDVLSTARLNGIYLDSVFYVFENFHQTFIQNKNLKGQGYADVDLEMVLNPALRLFSETLVSDIGLIIKNGELNNFEPIKKLDKYLDDEGLDRVRFSDLKNEIHIEKKKIYIPQMEVRTNVTNMHISGTHTLDQQIDYRIVTPLRSYRKINLGEAKSAIEEQADGQSKLYLRIAGTTDNYRVVYDAESVKKKIASDLKQQVRELRETFKNKGKKKEKELELESDEYFEWDDN